jgi:hypothetical protein
VAINLFRKEGAGNRQPARGRPAAWTPLLRRPQEGTKQRGSSVAADRLAVELEFGRISWSEVIRWCV